MYVRSKPGKGNVKQTSATKNSASDFGRASSLAKAIRLALFPILQNHSDNAFYRRLTTKANAATQANNATPKGSRALIDGDLTLLDHIDCNNASPFASHCGLFPTRSISGSRELTIALPEFALLEQIFVPAGATDAELVFLVTAINPVTNTESHAQMFRLELPLKESIIAAQQWTTEALPEAQLVILASAVFYYRKNNLAGMVAMNGKEHHPCEISAVLKT